MINKLPKIIKNKKQKIFEVDKQDETRDQHKKLHEAEKVASQVRTQSNTTFRGAHH